MNNIIYIHYYEKTYKFNIDDNFFKEYIINTDERIIDIYYISSILNITTINDDFIDEIECCYNS
jgi:hypothetical protein